MSDKTILVVPVDLAKKIDDYVGDMSRVEFIAALIDNLVTEKPRSKDTGKAEYVTRTEFLSFEQDMKQLLKSFLDFFISYGLDLSEHGQLLEIEKFTSKLQEIQKDLGGDGSTKGSNKATIKWKP